MKAFTKRVFTEVRPLVGPNLRSGEEGLTQQQHPFQANSKQVCP